MVEVGGRGALDDLPVALVQLLHLEVVALGEAVVVVVAALQEALDARARVLRAHACVTSQHHAHARSERYETLA